MDLPEMIDGSPYALLDDFKVGKELIPKMLGKARKMATALAKKVIEGHNPNEVMLVKKVNENKGFFERFFNFFN